MKCLQLEVIFLILTLFSKYSASINTYYGPNSGTLSLTNENFNFLVKQSDSFWVIQFYKPESSACHLFYPHYLKVAENLKAFAKFGVINANEEKVLTSKFDVKEFPTIKFYDGNSFQDYIGPKDFHALSDVTFANIRKKYTGESGVDSSKIENAETSESDKKEEEDQNKSKKEKSYLIPLNDENFEETVLKSEDPWIVEFYALWCQHCKKFTEEFTKAAKELKGKVKFGIIDGHKNKKMADIYVSRGYPTIKFFPAGNKTVQRDYTGGLTSDNIVSWIEDKLTVEVVTPELTQVVDNEILTKSCSKYSLCVIAVLPHILDCNAKCRNGYLAILKTVRERFKTNNDWSWLWAAAGDYDNLQDALTMRELGYPAMAAVNAKKKMFSLFRGSFADKNIGDFLEDIWNGKGTAEKINGKILPKLEEIEAWDGKDGQLPIVEEEEFLNENKKDEL